MSRASLGKINFVGAFTPGHTQELNDKMKTAFTAKADWMRAPDCDN